MDKQPTQEQIKEFWKWCGFKFTKDQRGWGADSWITPTGGFLRELPALDLNNLFKYAVPKINKNGGYIHLDQISGRTTWECQITLCNCSNWTTVGEFIDPALALFWAIWKVTGYSLSEAQADCAEGKI